jgi:large subunit ribosomal protein L6
MIKGVTEGFARRLEINGIGYNAKLNGRVLEVSVGFSKPVRMDIPAGLNVEMPNPTLIAVSGADKALLGHFAATLRKIRPPEPYKGKGIRYEGEEVRRKAGKAFVGHEL